MYNGKIFLGPPVAEAHDVGWNEVVSNGYVTIRTSFDCRFLFRQRDADFKPISVRRSYNMKDSVHFCKTFLYDGKADPRIVFLVVNIGTQSLARFFSQISGPLSQKKT